MPLYLRVKINFYKPGKNVCLIISREACLSRENWGLEVFEKTE